jgi:hypothetical protein
MVRDKYIQESKFLTIAFCFEYQFDLKTNKSKRKITEVVKGKLNKCRHPRLSDWETELFDSNCQGRQVRKCLDCGVVVKKREISSDCTKQNNF